MVVTSILGLVAFPPALAAFVLLLFDRRLGGWAFDPQGGGDPIIYQHLFWFLGHPEVYILILPFFGVITEIIPVFSRKPLFGYTGFVLATLAIGALSTGVWAHHMFTTGEVDNPFFSAMTLLIAVPTGVKFFNWIGTMWGGRIRFGVPMLFSIGFLLNFLIGGVTGVMLASAPIDYSVSDSYFLVSHFHYTMMGGSVFGIFAAIYFWWPKMTGYLLSERMGRAVFALLFVGFNLTFWPQFVLGLRGMPRRIVDYAGDLGWDTPNLVSTIGAGVLTIGVLAVPGGRVDLPAPANAVRGRPLGRVLAGVGHHLTAPRAQLLVDAADPIGTPGLRPAPSTANAGAGEGGRDAVKFALRYFALLSAFGLGLGTIYWFLTYEVVGAVVLWCFGLMPLIVATWWWRQGTDPATEASDDPEASPSDAAGHAVGSFPLASGWPIFLVLGVIVTGASLVYGLILAPAGAALLLWAIVGLARESRP